MIRFADNQRRRADLAAIERRELQWMPLLERVYRLKADRDTQWALFDADTEYQRTLEKARIAQTYQMAQIERQQTGATERTNLEIAATRQTAQEKQRAEQAEREAFQKKYGVSSAQEGQLALDIKTASQKETESGQKAAQEKQMRDVLYTQYGTALGKEKDWFDTGPIDELYKQVAAYETEQREGRATTEKATAAWGPTRKDLGDAWEYAVKQKPDKIISNPDFPNPKTGNPYTQDEVNELRKDAQKQYLTMTSQSRMAELGGAAVAPPPTKKLKPAPKEDATLMAKQIEQSIGRKPTRPELEKALNAIGMTVNY